LDIQKDGTGLQTPLVLTNDQAIATGVGVGIDFFFSGPGPAATRGSFGVVRAGNANSDGTDFVFNPNDGSTGNVERIRIIGKTGDIGIGTTTPGKVGATTTLAIQGALLVSGTTTVAELNVSGEGLRNMGSSTPRANTLYKENIVKALANWDVSGGSPSLLWGFNVSTTITDNGAGDFTFTLLTPCVNTTNMIISGFTVDGFVAVGSVSFTVSTVRVQTQSSSGVAVDRGNNGFVLFCEQ